jgi:hypothetical protein
MKNDEAQPSPGAAREEFFRGVEPEAAQNFPAVREAERSAGRLWAGLKTARRTYLPLLARIFSISSITRFIDLIVRSSGSSVVMSTPASLRRSIGYFDPPALRNER